MCGHYEKVLEVSIGCGAHIQESYKCLCDCVMKIDVLDIICKL